MTKQRKAVLKTELNFQLKKIELIETCINAPQKQLPEGAVFHFDINLEHRINLDENIVFVICFISITDEAKSQIFGKLKAGCIFEINDLSQFQDAKTKKYLLPEVLKITLNSICISTIRGIMFSHFRGTWLHNAVLPIIDLKEVTPESHLPNSLGD